jgi:hypothetical protein
MILKKYNKLQDTGEFRAMTLDEARQLTYGGHVWFKSVQGDARRAKVNGQPKTWKRSPERIEVSLKYGLYEYAKFNEQDIHAGRLLVEESPYPDAIYASLGTA